MDQVVFGRAGKIGAKLYSLAIMGKSMVKSGGECHGSCGRRTGNVVRSLCVDEGSGSKFQESWQQYVSRGDNTGEDQSPTCQGENPRSGLNWLCLAMILLNTLF